MNDLPNKSLLRVSEVADFFSVTERTIRLWVEHEKLKEVRTPGRSIRVTRESVVDWVRTWNKRNV